MFPAREHDGQDAQTTQKGWVVGAGRGRFYGSLSPAPTKEMGHSGEDTRALPGSMPEKGIQKGAKDSTSNATHGRSGQRRSGATGKAARDPDPRKVDVIGLADADVKVCEQVPQRAQSAGIRSYP